MEVDTRLPMVDPSAVMIPVGAFVNETQYKTEAEKGKGCAYYLNGEPVWEESLNWRAPGFEQTSEFPAVCLTKK